MEYVKSSKTYQGHYDNDEEEERLYNQRSISLAAERSFDEKKRRKVIRPHLFVVRFDMQTQLSQIPDALHPLISDEVREYNTLSTLGDYRSLQSIEYSIEDSNGDIDISRNISYLLQTRDHDIVHEASETDEKDTFEHVPLQHESSTLHIARRPEQERIEDVTDRIPYELVYDDLFDGIGNSIFYNEFVAARNADSTLSILALIHSIKTGSSIPDILHSEPGS
ncbi:hypothetical protein D3C85_1057530 [compost metagenome]